MANTTNFGWETPDDTDLVKDGAAAIRTLGSSIDTSFVDLKGGTTGQVLSKTSNTDLDFTWVAQDDSNAIQNAIVDAKGDLITATAADTPARLAVGANDTILTADSTTATGLKWATPSAGGLTLLSTTTLTGSSVVVSSINQTYTNLYILITDVDFSINDYMIIRPNSATSGLNNVGYSSANTSGVTRSSAWNTTQARNVVSTAVEGTVALNIYNYASSTEFKVAQIISSFNDNTSGGFAVYNTIGAYESTSAITSIQFRCDGAGSFDAGTVKIYGVK